MAHDGWIYFWGPGVVHAGSLSHSHEIQGQDRKDLSFISLLTSVPFLQSL